MRSGSLDQRACRQPYPFWRPYIHKFFQHKPAACSAINTDDQSGLLCKDKPILSSADSTWSEFNSYRFRDRAAPCSRFMYRLTIQRYYKTYAIVAVMHVCMCVTHGLSVIDSQEGDLRLAGRVDINGFATGALQVFIDGAFGGVCVSNFGTRDADVACRQMGFAGGTYVPHAVDAERVAESIQV